MVASRDAAHDETGAHDEIGAHDETGAHDEIGAHVSNGKGVQNAPGRARDLNSRVFQLFTKQAQRWAEPALTPEAISAFREACDTLGIDAKTSHDSYLINLASPDDALRERSIASFAAELERCQALGIEMLVTHPGNATDRDFESGIARNADGLLDAIDRVPGDTIILLETTAGTGSSLGASFDQLAAILRRLESAHARFAVCVDICHIWAAGYDIRSHYDDVFHRFDDTIGIDRLRLFHLNDSATPFASRRDRHADIGEGSIGDPPFDRIVNDPRFTRVPKVIETPKLPDVLTADRRNLDRLRGYRYKGSKSV
jgi:deoxyribonuclease-4